MRVLLFPAAAENVLAHVGVCISIGSELARRGHDVAIGYGGPLADDVRGAGLRVEPVRMLRHRIAGSRPLAHVFEDGAEMAQFARDDAAALERIRPDAVVVETRTTGRLACELVGVPYVSIAHSLAGRPWFREPSPWRRRARWLTRPQRAPAYLRRTLRNDDATGLRTFARRYYEARGLLGLRRDVDFFAPVGPMTVACLTTPLLEPSVGLPETWHYVGPVTWSAPADGVVPARDARPLVYLTQGSTGSAGTLRRAVTELAGEDVDVVATTADLCDPAELEAVAPNVKAARLLPGDEIVERADAVVAHGGNVTMLAVHRAGKPVVVLPHGYDQWLWADRVERLGTGVSLRPPLLPGAIRRAVRRVLRAARYRDAAQAVALHLREWDGAARTSDLVESLLPR